MKRNSRRAVVDELRMLASRLLKYLRNNNSNFGIAKSINENHFECENWKMVSVEKILCLTKTCELKYKSF